MNKVTSPSSETQHSITGSLNPLSLFRADAGIGWLTLTWPSGQLSMQRVLTQYVKFLGDEWGQSFSSKYYSAGRKSLLGTLIAWSPRNPRSMISIPQSAIEAFQLLPFLRFVNWMLEVSSARPTRIDTSLTFSPGAISTDLILESLQAGHYVGSARRYKPYIEYDIKTGKRINDGLTIGSRTSETFYRAYDKTLESKGKIEGYRLEGEYKDQVAQTSLRYILHTSCQFKDYEESSFVDSVCSASYQAACAEIVLGRIDFRRRGEKAHIEDCPRVEWWGSIHKQLYCFPYKQVTPRNPLKLEFSLEWFYNSMAKLFSTLGDFHGDPIEFAAELHKIGRDNRCDKYRSLLNQALAGSDSMDLVAEKFGYMLQAKYGVNSIDALSGNEVN